MSLKLSAYVKKYVEKVWIIF